MEMSHLLFANDTLVLGNGEADQVRNIRRLLLCFEVVTGLKVNLNKSEIVPIGPVHDITAFGEILGCHSLFTHHLPSLKGNLHLQASPSTSYLSSQFLLPWLINWSEFRGASCGVTCIDTSSS